MGSTTGYGRGFVRHYGDIKFNLRVWQQRALAALSSRKSGRAPGYSCGSADEFARGDTRCRCPNRSGTGSPPRSHACSGREGTAVLGALTASRRASFGCPTSGEASTRSNAVLHSSMNEMPR